jgi:hypothetical protein
MSMTAIQPLMKDTFNNRSPIELEIIQENFKRIYSALVRERFESDPEKFKYEFATTYIVVSKNLK